MGRTIETELGIREGMELVVTKVRIEHIAEGAYPITNAQVLKDVKEIMDGLNSKDEANVDPC